MSARRRWPHWGMLLASLFPRTSSFSTSALLFPHRRGQWHFPLALPDARGSLPPLAANSNDGDEEGHDDDEDDDELAVKPYRNRSLAWTLRYRRVNPYEAARARVLGFGHRSREDWDDAVASGQLGQYVPSHPDEMYAREWVSWEEWLGLMRGYEDARNLAANVLGLRSLDEYLLFVKSDARRAEGLRIPVRPDIYYKDDWIDEETFFGKS